MASSASREPARMRATRSAAISSSSLFSPSTTARDPPAITLGEILPRDAIRALQNRDLGCRHGRRLACAVRIAAPGRIGAAVHRVGFERERAWRVDCEAGPSYGVHYCAAELRLVRRVQTRDAGCAATPGY